MKPKLMQKVMLIAGFMVLTGCAATNTNAEFSCKAPNKTRCEPLSQVNARVTIEDNEISKPFQDGLYWER